MRKAENGYPENYWKKRYLHERGDRKERRIACSLAGRRGSDTPPIPVRGCAANKCKWPEAPTVTKLQPQAPAKGGFLLGHSAIQPMLTSPTSLEIMSMVHNTLVSEAEKWSCKFWDFSLLSRVCLSKVRPVPCHCQTLRAMSTDLALTSEQRPSPLP